MATSTFSTGNKTLSTSKEGHFIEGIGFDRLMAALTCWFIGGLFLDGWAHDHGFVDNTFFTPWHGVLYSGYFSTAISLIVVTLINHRRGRGWLQAIPQGYTLALLGVPLFTAAGLGDLLWHTLFGFEVGIEPLLSPSHLVLALAGILMAMGPLRATWLRPTSSYNSRWKELLPALLALLAVFSVLTFFTTYAHPLVEVRLVTHAANNSSKSYGVAGILLQTALLMGMLFVMMRRWRLPVGSLTLLIAVNSALMTVFANDYYLIPTALIAGITADLLYWKLRPSTKNVEGLRIFAFCVPLVYYLLYFGTLEITSGITWTIHLWLGAPIIAGVVGLFMSYIMAPPVAPAEALEDNE